MLFEIDNESDKQYLLHPFSALMKLTLFLQKPDMDKPRIQAIVDVDKPLCLEFDNRHYRHVLNTTHYFLNFGQYERYRELRPAFGTDIATLDGRLEYFRFLLRCIRKDLSRIFFTREQLVQRQRDQQQYITLLKKRVRGKNSLVSHRCP